MNERANPPLGRPAPHGDGPRYLIIGRVRKPHGINGELKIAIESELPERFTWLRHVWLSRNPNDRAPRQVAVENVRFHGDDALVKLAGYDDPETAGHLRQHWVFVPIEQALPLEADEYYSFQIIGFRVETRAGRLLGTLASLLETGANDVFVVDGPLGELLLPDIPDVVLDIDLTGRRIVVEPLPGLLPDDASDVPDGDAG